MFLARGDAKLNAVDSHFLGHVRVLFGGGREQDDSIVSMRMSVLTDKTDIRTLTNGYVWRIILSGSLSLTSASAILCNSYQHLFIYKYMFVVIL